MRNRFQSILKNDQMLYMRRPVSNLYTSKPIHEQPGAAVTSVAVLAETSLTLPRKLYIFTIKQYIYSIKVSRKRTIQFWWKLPWRWSWKLGTGTMPPYERDLDRLFCSDLMRRKMSVLSAIAGASSLHSCSISAVNCSCEARSSPEVSSTGSNACWAIDFDIWLKGRWALQVPTEE